jgi:tetratricopeptide (TPR) repeat protein
MMSVVNAVGHLTTVAALPRALGGLLGRLSGFAGATDAHHVPAFRYPAIVLTVFLAVFPAIAAPQSGLPVDRLAGSSEAILASGATPPDPGSARLEPIPHEEVVAIPPALLERLQREVIAPTRSRNKRLDLLVALLFEPAGLTLQYDGSRTRTVAESIADRKANCLSFSLLFTALARLAGIEADVQESDHVLVGHQDGVLYSNGHVNVSVHISGTRKTVDIDRSVMAVRGEARRVTDDRALSHFYNNRGAELMEAGELDAAQRHFELAVRITPGFVAAWNNLGVLNMRKGLLSESEHAYARVLDKNPRHAPALSNLVKLHRRRGDSTKQVEFEKRLFRVQSKDPFHQVVLAMGYEHKGDYERALVHYYERALVHYRRALRLQEDEPYIHFGMARAYAHLGETQRAAEELMRARDRASDQRSLYQAKLDRLRRLHRP